MKLIAAVALALASTSEAFSVAPSTQASSSTALNAAPHFATRSTGPGRYHEVTDSEGYQSYYYGRDQSGVSHYGYRKEEHVPGTTGGPGGSTLVSDFIMKDSVYGPNYHYVQKYRSSRPQSLPPPGTATTYNDRQLRQPWNQQSSQNYSAAFPKQKVAEKVAAK